MPEGGLQPPNSSSFLSKLKACVVQGRVPAKLDASLRPTDLFAKLIGNIQCANSDEPTDHEVSFGDTNPAGGGWS